MTNPLLDVEAPYKCQIPAGKRGLWEISKFELTEDQCGSLLDALRDIRDTGSDRRATPGHYTRLTRSGSIVMTDTPAEIRDLQAVRFHAKGRVLLHGLGLGIAAELALLHPKCKSVTVIEKSENVIALVEPTLKKRWGARLKVIHANAFEWQPPRVKFNLIWSDIWDTISKDNLKGMRKLQRMWSGRTNIHDFWCYQECLRSAR